MKRSFAGNWAFPKMTCQSLGRLVLCRKEVKMLGVPLEGIMVISFGTGAVIPDFGKILGELGADVIKIESRGNPDFARTLGPTLDSSAGFNESNRSKRSLGINLKTEKGRDLVKRLIKMSDIIGENFRGGVMQGFGLDYEAVNQIKPDIIYISSQGFGGGGPYSDYEAYGPMLSAFSGMLSLWAHPNDPYPVGSNAALPDHMCSKLAVVAVLAALDYRRRTGKGQFIDMAQIEVAATLIGEVYLDYNINKRIRKPMGNRNPYSAPNGCYRCKGEDEWCAISVLTDDEWQRFCDVLGNPGWTKDPKFTDILGRLNNVDELDKQVEEWTVSRDAREVMETLQGVGIAAGVVQKAPYTIEDPQLKWRDAIIEIDHPVVGKKIYPGIPFKFSEMPLPQSTPAPLLGQHTDEICREILKMSEEEIRRLKEEGVLESPSI
jgi:benzylsuccinate CoA-transferase BbsF subunit